MPISSRASFADPLRGREEPQPRLDQAGGRVGDAGVEAIRRLRRVGLLGEEVEELAGGLRPRVGEAEGLPVELGLVGDVVDRVGDEVDRDDVDLAPLDANRRQPGKLHAGCYVYVKSILERQLMMTSGKPNAP